MLFKGRYINGKFVPDITCQTLYRAYIRNIEELNIIAEIEIREAKRYSDAQFRFFTTIIRKVAEETGNTFYEVLSSLNSFRLMKETDGGMIFKDFKEYDTKEFTKFIEDAIAHLTEFFNIEININDKSILNVNSQNQVADRHNANRKDLEQEPNGD